ncbi:MAG: hypothetical protein AB1782_17645, partial [Cyanobacteriota bacterium]
NLKALTPELDTNSINWKIYFPRKASFWPIALFSNLQEDKSNVIIQQNTFIPDISLGRLQKSTVNKLGSPCPEPCATEVLKGGEAEEQLDGVTRSNESNTNDYKQTELRSTVSEKKLSLNQEMPRQDAGAIYPQSQAKSQMIQQFATTFKSRKIGKLPVYIDLPEVGNSYDFYQISFQSNKEPYIWTVYSNAKVFEYFLLTLLILFACIAAKPIKEKQYKTVRFILPAVLFVITLFMLLGTDNILLLILFAVLFGIYLLAKWIYSLQGETKVKALKITGSIVAVIFYLIILFLALLMDVICFGFVILLSILAGIIAVVVLLVKSEKLKWPKKKKKSPEEPDIELNTEANEERKEEENE